MRARVLRRTGLLAAVAAGGAGAWLGFPGVEGPTTTTPDPSTATEPRASAAVERRDLAETETVQGRLVFRGAADLVAARAGTLTWLAPEGAVVRRGAALFALDGAAVRLLYGRTPAWRGFADGMSDGADVRQLEANLVAMGFDPSGEIEVDGEFDDATEAAVERWEEALGMEEDGVLEPGDIVFRPGPTRVGGHAADVGAAVAPGTPVAAVSENRRAVVLDLSPEDRSLVRAGSSVQVTLPDGSTVPGRVARVGTVAQAGETEGVDATFEVIVSLPKGSAGRTLEGATVDVGLTRSRARDVLAVPVAALLALVEGGYGVELLEGSSTRLVGVEIGAFGDGWVEVRGDDVSEGDRVVVAR